jgi:hypothetical protein
MHDDDATQAQKFAHTFILIQLKERRASGAKFFAGARGLARGGRDEKREA